MNDYYQMTIFDSFENIFDEDELLLKLQKDFSDLGFDIVNNRGKKIITSKKLNNNFVVEITVTEIGNAETRFWKGENKKILFNAQRTKPQVEGFGFGTISYENIVKNLKRLRNL